MAEKVKVKPADFNKYFKGLDLKIRASVIETAETLLKVQNADTALLADAPIPPIEEEDLETMQ